MAKKKEEKPFKDFHCEDCRFFHKSTIDGNRFGHCAAVDRTVFTKYACEQFFLRVGTIIPFNK